MRLEEITRVTARPLGELKAGEIMRKGEEWWLSCPNCARLSNVTTWNPEIHEDGTVSLNPSIWHKGHYFTGVGDESKECGAHYFIKRSKIQWC